MNNKILCLTPVTVAQPSLYPNNLQKHKNATSLKEI